MIGWLIAGVIGYALIRRDADIHNEALVATDVVPADADEGEASDPTDTGEFYGPPKSLFVVDLNSIVTLKGHGKTIRLGAATAQAFISLQKAASNVGFVIEPISGYRSTAEQKVLFDKAVMRYGSESLARKYVARPGGSMHESGVAIDIYYPGISNDSLNVRAIQQTPLYHWVESNMGSFGFRFYDRNIEPWHIEYVGA